jgi:hypothetical protein
MGSEKCRRSFAGYLPTVSGVFVLADLVHFGELEMTPRDQPKPYCPPIKEGLRRLSTGWQIALEPDMKHWRVWRPVNEMGGTGCFVAAFFDIEDRDKARDCYLENVK